MNGLVLSGGGGRGAYEYGVYKALRECGIEFDVVAGTSVGAITAAFIVSGMEPKEVEEAWKRMGTFKVLQPRADFWAFPKWTHFVYMNPLRRFLDKHLDIEAVRRSPMTLRVTAVDVNSGELHVFRNRDLTLDHLLASSAIPLLFPLVTIGERTYWDGGAVANTPIGPAIEAGATDIFCVLLSPMGTKALPTPRNMWEAITRLSDLRLLGNLKEDIKQAEAINKLVKRGLADPRWRHVDFHVISPEEGLGIVTVLNFSAKKAVELIEHGYRDGLAFMADGHDHPVEAQSLAELADDMAHRGQA